MQLDDVLAPEGELLMVTVAQNDPQGQSMYCCCLRCGFLLSQGTSVWKPAI